jgi:hypothetical protein
MEQLLIGRIYHKDIQPPVTIGLHLDHFLPLVETSGGGGPQYTLQPHPLEAIKRTNILDPLGPFDPHATQSIITHILSSRHLLSPTQPYGLALHVTRLSPSVSTFQPGKSNPKPRISQRELTVELQFLPITSRESERRADPRFLAYPWVVPQKNLLAFQLDHDFSTARWQHELA